MTELVLVFIGNGGETYLNPALTLRRSRKAASNRSLETFSGSSNNLPSLLKAAPSHEVSPHRRVELIDLALDRQIAILAQSVAVDVH